MKFKLIIFYILLILLETAVGFVIALAWVLIMSPQRAIDKQIFDASIIILINLWRIIFYSIPTIIALFVLFKFFNFYKIYNPIFFSISNSLLFAGLNLLYKLHRGLPTLGFTEDIFWITIISIFVAPLILEYFKYYKMLIKLIATESNNVSYERW